MDYTIGRDELGRCFAQLSMGQEAFGTWLAEELGEDGPLLKRIIEAVDQLSSRRIREFRHDGNAFSLELDRDEARVRSHSLGDDTATANFEDLDFYDDELEAGCGLDDFHDLLLAWQELTGG